MNITMRGRLFAGLLTAAATMAAFPARASFVSTAPPGFVPATFDIAGPSVTTGFDLNGDGTVDYYISVIQGQQLALIPAAINLIAYVPNSVFVVDVFASPASFQGGASAPGGADLAYASNGAVSDYLSADSGALDLTFVAGPAYDAGYIAVTLAVTGGRGAQDAVLTVTDYGYDRASVPEPGTIALLFAGLLGVLALRAPMRPSRAR